MKTCTKCGVEKQENDFFYQNRHANKLHAQCKSCYVTYRRKMWKDHYYKHGNQYRERAVERNKKIRDRLRVKVLEYLSDKSCLVCGISDPRVLEFDHIDPTTKSFGIARALTNAQSWGNILAEINKCQILCANCHKIRTAEQQGWYKNPEFIVKNVIHEPKLDPTE